MDEELYLTLPIRNMWFIARIGEAKVQQKRKAKPKVHNHVQRMSSSVTIISVAQTVSRSYFQEPETLK